MTDVAANVARYELVPGVSAYRLSRLMRVVVVACAMIVGVLVFFVRSTFDGEKNELLLLATLWGVAMVPIIVFGVWLGIRERAETAAGYTTMTRGHSNLNQVDPLTGVVIREAGSVVFTSPTHAARTAGSMSAVAGDAPTDVAARFVRVPNPIQKSLMKWGVVLATLIMGVLLVIVFVSPVDPNANQGSILIGRAVMTGCAALLALAMAFVTVGVRAKLRTAALAQPDAFVFLTERTPELSHYLRALQGHRPRLPQHFAVAIGPKGIALWGGGRSKVPLVMLPWAEIDHVHPGRLVVETGRISVAVLALHFFSDRRRASARFSVSDVRATRHQPRWGG